MGAQGPMSAPDDFGHRALRAGRSLLGTVEALLAILTAGWRLRRRHVGEKLSLRPNSPVDSELPSLSRPAGRSRTRASAESVAEARGIARRLGRACRVLPWEPSCLVRALALKRLLDRRGMAGTRVRVGVRRQNGDFSAHAWLECEGVLVGDAPDTVAEYELLTGFDVQTE